jgi:hypothetical protein
LAFERSCDQLFPHIVSYRNVWRQGNAWETNVCFTDNDHTKKRPVHYTQNSMLLTTLEAIPADEWSRNWSAGVPRKMRS